MMKLKKQYAGCYTATAMVDGHTIEVEVNAYEEAKGFYYEVRVDGHMVDADGWHGLRLKDIKQIIQDAESYLEMYKAN